MLIELLSRPVPDVRRASALGLLSDLLRTFTTSFVSNLLDLSLHYVILLPYQFILLLSYIKGTRNVQSSNTYEARPILSISSA